MTISVLPDNVLLEIFCFYKKENPHRYRPQGPPMWKWGLLVHVCRRWRQVVFASPLLLDLRILCTARTPVGKNLGIWPALPIYVECGWFPDRRNGNNAPSYDNIITALKHVDRVCDVRLEVMGSELEKITTVMHEPFPVLTRLFIWSEDGNAPVLPAEFLGGSAPRLQFIYMFGIPFPALPALLLSTSDLVSLDLSKIPPSGYISPEAFVVGLAALPRLRDFTIEIRSATPRPDRIHLPPVTRTVLPALTRFEFRGASEYLEDLASRIDTPQLDWTHIFYFNQLVDFQVPQLAMFLDRTVGPKLTQSMYAQVNFCGDRVTFDMSRHANNYRVPDYARTGIACQGLDWQVSHISQVLGHISATLSNVVHLKLDGRLKENSQLKGIDDVDWLHFLHQFPTARTLHVSQKLAAHVALTLQDLALEAVTQTPPSLDLIYLADQPASSIEKFVAARKRSGRPVSVVETETEFDEKLEPQVRK